MRMPLFFFVSGLLAARSLGRTLRSSYRQRILSPYYLYAIWLGLSCIVYTLIGSIIDGPGASSFDTVFSALAYPISSLWYLYALAAYYLLAKMLGRFSRAFALAVAVSLAILASFWPVGVQTSVIGNFSFYLLGAYFPDAAKKLARTANLTRVGIAALLYLLVIGVYVVEVDGVPGVRPLASAVAVWVGVVLLAFVAKWQPASRPLSYLGRRTLPIYVLHLPLLALVDEFVRMDLSGHGWATVLLAFIYPALLLACVVGVSIVIEKLLRRMGVSGLFSLPNFSSVRWGRRGWASGTTSDRC